MGGGGSKGGKGAEHAENIKAAKPADDKINKLVAARKKVEDNNHKLLILGAGESGKSTLFKQWRAIYGHGFSEEERTACKTIISKNTIESMQTLLEVYKGFGITLKPESKESERIVAEVKMEDALTPALAAHIKNLWADPGLKECFRQRAAFQILDSAEYLFEHADSYAKEDYIPTEVDCLRSRVRTTGIVEERFDVDNHTITVLDVGGQRTERKKWIHCFEGVTCVLFVAAISEYDQKLFEDEKVNRMDEAMNLFEEVLNMKWFQETSMILFMNKTDLFEKKFKEVPLNKYFPDFRGSTAEEGKIFLRDKFLAKDKNQDRDIYANFTSAIDRDNIKAVLKAVKDIVLRRYLEDGGFI